MSGTLVFEWHKFVEGRENVEDDKQPGRPLTGITEQNVTKLNENVHNDSRWH